MWFPLILSLLQPPNNVLFTLRIYHHFSHTNHTYPGYTRWCGIISGFLKNNLRQYKFNMAGILIFSCLSLSTSFFCYKKNMIFIFIWVMPFSKIMSNTKIIILNPAFMLFLVWQLEYHAFFPIEFSLKIVCFVFRTLSNILTSNDVASKLSETNSGNFKFVYS